MQPYFVHLQKQLSRIPLPTRLPLFEDRCPWWQGVPHAFQICAGNLWLPSALFIAPVCFWRTLQSGEGCQSCGSFPYRFSSTQ
eukprot:3144870-Amphidinium_carterae.1